MNNFVAWALLSLLVATSCRQPCSSEPSCVTRCGSIACSTVNCASLQAAEDRAVAVFDDAGFDTCRALSGYSIEIQRFPDGGPVGRWVDEYKRTIVGDTACDLKRIRLGRDEWELTAYSHEVRHVVDNCLTSEHEGWLDAGVFDQVEEAQ